MESIPPEISQHTGVAGGDRESHGSSDRRGEPRVGGWRPSAWTPALFTAAGIRPPTPQASPFTTPRLTSSAINQPHEFPLPGATAINEE